MNATDARALIEDETQWQAAPALSSQEVDRLLDRARAVDDLGRQPGDAGYEATYTGRSVNHAIAMGWRMKAGKVAAAVDVKAGDAEVKRSQQVESLTKRAVSYGAAGGGGIGSISLTSALGVASDEGY